MHLNWILVTCLLVLLSVGLTTRTVDAGKKSKKDNEEEEDSRSTDTDSDDDDTDDADKKAVFIPRERASIFLSYNECMRRMNCGVSRREECSEECAGGNTEEELEEYAEIFENLEEYRAVAKKNRPIRKSNLSDSSSDSDTDTDTDSDSDTDTESDSDSDSDDDSDSDTDTDTDDGSEEDDDEEEEEEEESGNRLKNLKKKAKNAVNSKRTSGKSNKSKRQH